jgi:hypothetical protein
MSFMLIKEVILQEEVAIANLYAPNSATNFIKHALLYLKKTETDPNQ